jgi:Flp pilus assembly protein TadG
MTSRTHKGERRRRLRARLRLFCGNERAATALEFALISMPFFALLIAILETMLVFFAQQCLETAGEAASRLIMTGQPQLGAWSQSAFKTKVCAQLPPVLGCNNLMVDVQTTASFSSVNTGTPTITYDASGNPKTNYVTGGAGDIVVVRLMYIWPIATGPLGFNLSNQSGGKRLLVSTSVAQTEPYNA